LQASQRLPTAVLETLLLKAVQRQKDAEAQDLTRVDVGGSQGGEAVLMSAGLCNCRHHVSLLHLTSHAVVERLRVLASELDVDVAALARIAAQDPSVLLLPAESLLERLETLEQVRSHS
jgi:hypothetical protein